MNRHERTVAIARTMSVLATLFPTRTRWELEEAATLAVDRLVPSPVHLDASAAVENREA